MFKAVTLGCILFFHAVSHAQIFKSVEESSKLNFSLLFDGIGVDLTGYRLGIDKTLFRTDPNKTELIADLYFGGYFQNNIKSKGWLESKSVNEGYIGGSMEFNENKTFFLELGVMNRLDVQYNNNVYSGGEFTRAGIKARLFESLILAKDGDPAGILVSVALQYNIMKSQRNQKLLKFEFHTESAYSVLLERNMNLKETLVGLSVTTSF